MSMIQEKKRKNREGSLGICFQHNFDMHFFETSAARNQVLKLEKHQNKEKTELDFAKT